MNQNVLAVKPIKSLIWKLGIPMIISMVLQAIYNVVDTVFIINMGETGQKANLALTYAFPIQIFMIAVGVGTGIGINALLSRKLGEKDDEGVKRVTGNGIFVGIIIYLIFLLIGLFFVEPYLKLQTNDPEIIKMGVTYLRICCVLSFGSVGYTIYERFLQASGKTLYSTISQISGAVTNIILDYVFIYPCKMGIAGAAYATIIGQILSLVVAMIFHYGFNKTVKNSLKGILPSKNIIGGIYKVGWSAILMQALLSINMFTMVSLFSLTKDNDLIQGTYGIYYKIYQISLFSCFGLSNTIITVLSFNIGLNDKQRIADCIKYGIIDCALVGLIITVLFEIFANQISSLFGLANGGSNPEIVNLTSIALRIASSGYIFMGFSLGMQGVYQAYRESIRPLILSLLRLLVLLVPLSFIFIYLDNAKYLIWIIFPIAELLTAIISAIMLKKHLKRKDINLSFAINRKQQR